MAVFLFGSHPKTPKEYAHIAVGGAHLLATGALANFRQPDFCSSGAASSVGVRPIPAYLQYVALGIACYWFYALRILHAKEAVQREMIQGLEEGLSQHLSIGGEPMPSAFRPDLPADIEAYMKALDYDYDHPDEMGVHNPDVCTVAKLHNGKMAKYYDPFFTKEDQRAFGTSIADVTTGLLSYIQQEHKLTLRQGIQDAAQHEQSSKTAAQQSNVPPASRTIHCPKCKVNLRFHDTGELKCRCPECKTTFRVDSGDRIYDTGCPWD